VSFFSIRKALIDTGNKGMSPSHKKNGKDKTSGNPSFDNAGTP